MSRQRWILSSLIVFHLMAVCVAVVPAPAEVPVAGPVRTPRGSDWLSNELTPAFDRAALVVGRAEPVLYMMLAPVRAVTQPYIAGLRQRWQMFADPFTEDRYVMLRYYVDSGGRTVETFSELVLPVGPDESSRYFRGKAIRNALDSYVKREFRETPLSADAAVAPEVYQYLVPVVRYYRDRFERWHPEMGRVDRTEFWYGVARIPPRGQRHAPGVLERRAEALAAYNPLRPASLPRAAAPRRGARAEDADIQWTLEYIDLSREPE